SPRLFLTSSTSCEACQKKRYGLMVVPSTAMSAVRYAFVSLMCGIRDACSTALQGTCTKKTTPTYAKSETVSHFKYFTYVEYGMNTTAIRDATPHVIVKMLAFPGKSNCNAAPIAPISAPRLKTLAMAITISTE